VTLTWPYSPLNPAKSSSLSSRGPSGRHRPCLGTTTYAYRPSSVSSSPVHWPSGKVNVSRPITFHQHKHVG